MLDQLRQELRVKHYSYRTEQTYSLWVRKFILFHGKRHPAEMGKPEIEAFLTHLATERDVAASTQNQAMSAILFLNRHGETRTGSRRQVAACKQARQGARYEVWSFQMSDEHPFAGSELKPPKASPPGEAHGCAD
ncbi:phage integrase N-terminal SAM-like domain-containing protein [Abyssibacter profundi]|uniref:phage integrase N-terminal SAM-like domain-containing protein n=1 Tax=Abyssibacter profundi TaxID=2182787 RepID=UPI003F6986B1